MLKLEYKYHFNFVTTHVHFQVPADFFYCSAKKKGYLIAASFQILQERLIKVAAVNRTKMLSLFEERPRYIVILIGTRVTKTQGNLMHTWNVQYLEFTFGYLTIT